MDSIESLVMRKNHGFLRRALRNAVRHAVRHAGVDGPTVLSAARDAEGLQFRVLDHGPGVPEDWPEKISEPLARPEQAPTRNGVGPGLAIARTCTKTPRRPHPRLEPPRGRLRRRAVRPQPLGSPKENPPHPAGRNSRGRPETP